MSDAQSNPDKNPPPVSSGQDDVTTDALQKRDAEQSSKRKTDELNNSPSSDMVTEFDRPATTAPAPEPDDTKSPQKDGDAATVGGRLPFSRKRPEMGQHDTAILSANNSGLRRALRQEPPSQLHTASLGERREIILLIRGMVERLLLVEKVPYKLGRFDLGTTSPNEVDLTPYGALDRGVSRIHAQLHLEDEHLYVTDLGSTNGTYLAGKRLEPNEPTLLRKGDELVVGRLVVQVLFR